GGIAPCRRTVPCCASPTGSAGHASATASLKLTFHLDHSVGANHKLENLPELPLRRLAVQTRKAKNLLGRDAVDVPPETAIELAESFELPRHRPGRPGHAPRSC